MGSPSLAAATHGSRVSLARHNKTAPDRVCRAVQQAASPAASARSAGARPFPDTDQFDFEDQCGSARDLRRSPSATVAQPSRNDELPLAADLHPCDTLIPACDDLPRSEHKLEGLHAAPGAIEDRAVDQCAHIVNDNPLARDGFLPLTEMKLFNLQLAAPSDDGPQDGA